MDLHADTHEVFATIPPCSHEHAHAHGQYEAWKLALGSECRIQSWRSWGGQIDATCARWHPQSLSVAWSAFIVTSALSGLGWDRIQSLHWSSSEETISSPRHVWAFFPWQLLWRNTARHLNEQKQRRSPVCWMSRMDFSTALWSQHTLPCGLVDFHKCLIDCLPSLVFDGFRWYL